MNLYQLKSFRPVALIVNATIFLSLLAINPAFAQLHSCPCCDNPEICRTPEHIDYFENLKQRFRAANPNAPAPNAIVLPSSTQVVYLEFDIGGASDLVYTQAQRDAIEVELERIYDRFDVSFTQTMPLSLSFSQGSSRPLQISMMTAKLILGTSIRLLCT